MMIDVSVLKSGDQYYNLAEGWVYVDFVEDIGECWRIWDEGEFIQVLADGKHFEGCKDWDVLDVKIADGG